MPAYPVNPVVMAEARRLAAEDLDRDLDRVAELLAEQGHYGPDGRPYPARTVANLLDEELRRRRDDRWRERNRPAMDDFNCWLEREGHKFLAGGDPEGSRSRTDGVPTAEPKRPD
ncbi:type II toxin-antitoxin system CcdA family antitoxin [Siccirubricoccus sp. KC 17139]|uniref:Type II toxin-antitoxin system CcdA family antitoxin n=1 Tax=Siccirubricoccus soli TaxID=2899147 RepID=A0ABT1D1S1_9PROT|nr:type II toxin-antitoxin system CcdA family antitoxin [Siccirubricoccus soli]MCO6415866.1 type II toxin-antitoxin system CcdA family antitoxin [Siccirubricoccus soli]MCP2681998.1 type II toxin-antitoxin system CcdA family antitoxin [Siccirubricoccus soli]